MKPWAEQFYNSEAWRRTRAAFLMSKGGMCERCAAADKVEVATIAHHIVYLTPQNINDPWVSLSFDNLEALCQSCHNEEHHGKPKENKYFFDEDGNILPTNSTPPIKNLALRGAHTEGEV
jgi:5-methylcytosine-specific restriction endonuclease McrA